MPAMSKATPAPIAPTARISALDAARGFALLGIFCVNIETFAEPFGRLVDPTPPTGLADVIAHYFMRIFCEGRFYPLFSAMFGIGLVLQMNRIRSAGGSFGALYARRLLVLGLMGITHALLLWYGDILFHYAIAGTVLLLCSRWSAKTLMRIGIGLLCFAMLLTTGLAALTVPPQTESAEPAIAIPAGPVTDESAYFEPGPDAPASPAPAAESDHDFDKTPFGRLMKGFQTGAVQQPQDPIWLQTETEAYRDGPYLQLFLFRLFSWLIIIVMSVISFGWHVLAMFFIGAGLMKKGFFDPASAAMPRRAMLLGASLGLPLSIGAAILPAWSMSGSSVAAAAALSIVGGTLMALGYLGGITMLVRSGRIAWLGRSLARVGRMGLTNYLLQTVVATSIFYYYGLGLFGQTTQPERLFLVFIIYASQHLFSLAWLSVFAMGPMEWFWRTLTYLRPQPLLRR